MAYKEVSRVDIVEVIRRWQKGNSQRQIASGTGLSRDTVRKYLAGAEEVGVSREGPDPSEEQVSRLAALSRSGPRKKVTPAEDLLEPWGDQIYRWITVDRLQVTRIGELLAQRGCQVSYTSLVAPFPATAPLAATPQRQNGADGAERPWRSGRTGLRPPGLHSGPGDRSPLRGVGPDSGAGSLQAQLRVAHLQPEAGRGHCRPGGGLGLLRRHPQVFGHRQLPRRSGRGRFPASPPDPWLPGILPAPGFITDPARVRHPRDKPKVERGVQYVRERFFKGGDFKDLTHLRNEAARWCRDVAGRRIHGTTRRQPLQVFLDEERQALNPWDGEPYEVTHWRTAKVHPDHHVACQYALYSVPSTLCPPGQQVEIGLGLKLVRIYHRGRLVKVHPRQPRVAAPPTPRTTPPS